MDVSYYTKGERINNVCKKIGFSNSEDLLIGIGDGVITPSQLVIKLREEYGKKQSQPVIEEIKKPVQKEIKSFKEKKTKSHGVRVKGIDDVMVRFARCCNPLPGDRIIGYITRGRGVSIHRNDCPNVKIYLEEEKERLLEAAWDEADQTNFQIQIEVLPLIDLN